MTHGEDGDWSHTDDVWYDQMIEIATPNEDHPMREWIDLVMRAMEELELNLTELEKGIEGQKQDCTTKTVITLADARQISKCESMLAAIEIMKDDEYQ